MTQSSSEMRCWYLDGQDRDRDRPQATQGSAESTCNQSEIVSRKQYDEDASLLGRYTVSIVGKWLYRHFEG